MPANMNGGGGHNGDSSGGYSPNYVNYLNQANVVQHQLEQFRMTHDSDASYMVSFILIDYRLANEICIQVNGRYAEHECILPEHESIQQQQQQWPATSTGGHEQPGEQQYQPEQCAILCGRWLTTVL